MKTVDFTFPGGFPFEQRTFKDMQEGYLEMLSGIFGFLKVQPAGNHIIFGCKVVGPNITPGMMYIDGDLCPFAGFAGDDTTKIKKLVTLTDAAFFGGINNPAYRETTAVLDGAGSALSTFTRFGDALVYDANYVHTDNNFTTAEQTKLFGIEAGAQVNVQADWDVISPLSDAFIKNKPIIPNVLRIDEAIIGDIGWGLVPDELIVINFPSVGTSDYKVFATLISQGNWNADNDVSFVIKTKTATSFSIALHEYSTDVQNLTLDYMIVKN